MQLIDTLAAAAPVALVDHVVQTGRRVGLVVVDEVNGFCTPGMGPLAPPAPDARIDQMIAETNALAQAFVSRKAPVMVFCDTHVPGRAEPPYPPHCEKGSGQEELVSALTWLETAPGVDFLEKDVINGYVGGVRADGGNVVLDWLRAERIETLVVVGICTDICVADFVLTMMSARNHYAGETRMLPDLEDVVVYEPATATYDLPIETARALGLPDTAAHPREVAHHMGLYLMQARGAVIARSLALS